MQHIKTMLLSNTVMLVGSVGLANAGVITQTQIADGTGVQNISGLTVTPSSGGFLHKTINGLTGVGIAGGSVSGEIDNQEFIRFAAPAGSSNTLNGFAVAFLYQNGNMGDQVNEVALLNAQGAVLTALTLTVSGPTTATLAGASGTVSNLSPATNAGGGAFRISDLNVGFTTLSSGRRPQSATPPRATTRSWTSPSTSPSPPPWPCSAPGSSASA